LEEYGERKVAPVCERIVILLEEVLGWSLWYERTALTASTPLLSLLLPTLTPLYSPMLAKRPQRYKAFKLDEEEIRLAIKQTLKMIEYCEWLAKEADDETLKYNEFTRWFRSGKFSECY
jgi:hypothetical protein